MSDLISKKTRLGFREHLVGTTLRYIRDEFDTADIDWRDERILNLSGERRTLVEQYYLSMDFSNWDDVRRLIVVYENILNDMELGAASDEYVAKEMARLIQFLRKDGFEYRDNRLMHLGEVSSFPQLKTIAAQLDAPNLRLQLDRIESSIETDPRLAIGTAKELIETTCKTILTERKVPVDPKWNLMDLVKTVRKELQLVPDDIPDSAKAADSIKRLLSNLATIVQGIAELRNPYGTGHGPDGRVTGLQPRHARLAAGAASTLATFLFETHQHRTEK